MIKSTETQPSSRLLLRVPEAAALLGLSRATLYQMLASGDQIPVVRVGRAVRIPLAGLQAWVEQQTGGWQPHSPDERQR